MERARFRVDWVLVNELAVGPAPRAPRHLDRLEEEGIRAILAVCDERDAPLLPGLLERFTHQRVVLPDHRSDRLPELAELQMAMRALDQLHQTGPVYVHCLAGVERSPLVCLAWLVAHHRQNPQQALEYLMQVHPGTNPLGGQYIRLKEFYRHLISG